MKLLQQPIARENINQVIKDCFITKKYGTFNKNPNEIESKNGKE